eukprot:jgi/Botrbrau1/801/Bobra.0181s0054.1
MCCHLLTGFSWEPVGTAIEVLGAHKLLGLIQGAACKALTRIYVKYSKPNESTSFASRDIIIHTTVQVSVLRGGQSRAHGETKDLTCHVSIEI